MKRRVKKARYDTSLLRGCLKLHKKLQGSLTSCVCNVICMQDVCGMYRNVCVEKNGNIHFYTVYFQKKIKIYTYRNVYFHFFWEIYRIEMYKLKKMKTYISIHSTYIIYTCCYACCIIQENVCLHCFFLPACLFKMLGGSLGRL